MAKCTKAFLRNKNRVFLKGDVLTTLARHSHKASAKACAGDSFMKDASSPGSRAGYPEGRPNPVRNTRTAKYCSCAQNLSMPIFGASCGGPRDKWNLPFHTGKCKPTPGGVALTFAISRLRLRRRH